MKHLDAALVDLLLPSVAKRCIELRKAIKASETSSRPSGNRIVATQPSKNCLNGRRLPSTRWRGRRSMTGAHWQPVASRNRYNTSSPLPTLFSLPTRCKDPGSALFFNCTVGINTTQLHQRRKVNYPRPPHVPSDGAPQAIDRTYVKNSAKDVSRKRFQRVSRSRLRRLNK